MSTKQHGQTPDTQLIPLREFAAHKGYILCDEYVDVGISGSKERRPELDRLMRDAKRRRFDAVLVWRFDRFARSVSHLVNSLAQFNALGVDFISITEAVDTSTAVGKMVFTIFAAIGEFERALIQERVLAGIARARKEGKKLGRPKVQVDRETVLQMLNAGHSKRHIARTLGVSRPVVDAALEVAVNPSHKGASN